MNSEVLPLMPWQLILRIRRFPNVSFERRRGFELLDDDDDEIDDTLGLEGVGLGDLGGRGRGVLDFREGGKGLCGGEGIVLADEWAKLTASVEDSRQKLW